MTASVSPNVFNSSFGAGEMSAHFSTSVSLMHSKPLQFSHLLNHPFAWMLLVFILLCIQKAEVLDERAHGAGELSASVGRSELMRRICDAEGYNIR